MMHGHGQSDRPAVPTNSPNNAGASAAEGREGRGLAKGNPPQQNAPRAQDRAGAPSALARVRQVAERDKQVRFTTLLHHIYNVDHLRAAYFALKRDAAPGIDGETWQHYGAALEENLRDLAFSTSTVARWTSLSSSVGMPSGRCRPSALARYARLTGFVRYADGRVVVPHHQVAATATRG
jgi:RNA-directed DNA polymerase